MNLEIILVNIVEPILALTNQAKSHINHSERGYISNWSQFKTQKHNGILKFWGKKDNYRHN